MNSVLFTSPLFLSLYGGCIALAILGIFIKKYRSIFYIASAVSYLVVTFFAIINGCSMQECMISLFLIIITMIIPAVKGGQ